MVLIHFFSFKSQILIVPSPELEANKSFLLKSMRKTGPVCSENSKGSMDLSWGVTLIVISSEQAAMYCKRYDNQSKSFFHMNKYIKYLLLH